MTSNPLDFNMGKPNILMTLSLAKTYRNEVIVIAMHEVITVVRIANIIRPFV